MKRITKADAEKAFQFAWLNAVDQVIKENYTVIPKALQLAADMATVLAKFHEPKKPRKKGK